MNRRAFLGSLAGVVLAGPFVGEARPPEKPYRVGMLAIRTH